MSLVSYISFVCGYLQNMKSSTSNVKIR